MAWTKEQELAINKKNTNIIVSAGAGSGKTAVLTERVLTHLKNGININELLILTFTNAAAFEMKERIRKNIKQSVKNNSKLKRDLELLDSSYITTFDAFALSIVKKYHYLLNISKDINITDDTIIKVKKQELLEETLEEFYEENDSLFRDFIKTFCVKDDESIQNCLYEISEKIDSMIQKEEFLMNYFEEFYEENFLNKCLNDYLEILLSKIEEINRTATKLSNLVDDDNFNESLNEILYPLLNSNSLEDIIKYVEKIKLPILKNASDEAKNEKENLSSEIKKLKETVNYYESLEEIKENIWKTKNYVTIILEIIKRYLNKVDNYKKENEIYDFMTVAKLAIKILKENESVRLELKNNLKEIMIDEYQDTNDLQETFINLIANDNVYMVGDIKQSIYRFRNANPYLFKNKYDNYSQNQNGFKIDLVKNFRSREEVLENINTIFNLIMDDVIGGADYKETHQMVFGNDSYNNEGHTNLNYNMRILEYESVDNFSKTEIEIFTIARDIQNKIKNKYQIFDKDNKILRDIEYKDFVILMDRVVDFDLYKKVFEYLNIPLDLYKDEKLNNNYNIYIIKNIIDFVIKIKEKQEENLKYDFISIARSYLFNLTDNEIFEIIKNNKIRDSKVYQQLVSLTTKLDNTSIKDFIYEIIDITKMNEKFITIGDIKENMVNEEKILALAENYNNMGNDIYKFNIYLEELLKNNIDIKYIINNNNNNAVKIMNIHKSKGLEYHICYYSGLYKEFNISDLKERFLIDNNYGIITPIFKEGIKDTLLKYLMKYKYMEEEISEKIRLFYVALTRAKETMILVTPTLDDDLELIDKFSKLKYRSFKDILSSIKKQLKKYLEKVDLSQLGLTKDYIYHLKIEEELTSNQNDSFKVEEILEFPVLDNENVHFSKQITNLINQNTKNNLELGTKFHEYFEYLDLKNPDLSNIEEFMKKKIESFLNISILKNLKDANIYHEYEFMEEEDGIINHGIIDLLIEHNDYVDIIDFKLKDLKDENYLKQLRGYQKYIEKITEKKVNIYLYSILNEELKELE